MIYKDKRFRKISEIKPFNIRIDKNTNNLIYNE